VRKYCNPLTLQSCIGKRKIITFAFHFFHFKTFSGKVIFLLFSLSLSLFKSDFFTFTFAFEKWKNHFSTFTFAFEKWKNHFSTFTFALKSEKITFPLSLSLLKSEKVKKSLKKWKNHFCTFQEKVLKWKKWKAKVIIFPVPMYDYSNKLKITWEQREPLWLVLQKIL